MIIPHFHASVPTGVGFSKQACLSKCIPSGLAAQLGRSGILAQEQMLFLAGHGAQARDYSTGENMPPAVAGLLQRAANSPTHNTAARH